MKYAVYKDYRESLLGWAGSIPCHWDIKKIGHLALLKSGENIVSEEIAEGGEFPVYGGNGLRGYFSQYTHDGQFVLVGRQGALCGNINYASGKFWASEHALVAHPLAPFDIKWFGETLRAMNLNQYSVSAAQPGLAASAISALRLPFPPLDEQQSIASFLDAKTAQIDELIAKKRQLIDKLKEKRQALIARTVTRGLPPEAAKAAGLEPNPAMKDSGHPWLADIPVHWELKRLKDVSELFGRIGFRGYSTEDLVYEGEGAISLSPSNMVNGTLMLEKCTWLSWEKYNESPEIKVEAGDLIMVKTGSTLGKAAFVAGVSVPMTINPQLMIFKNVRCSRRFLFYYLISSVIQDVIPLHNTGSTIPTMTQEGIGKLPFPCPAMNEQEAIAEFLDEQEKKHSQMVARVESVMGSLAEYRQALITSAVTGKIDVRNWQAQEAAA